MGRIYGGAYQGPDGIYHYPYTDDVTGERGEDLSFEPPEMFGPSGLTQADYNWQAPDPWLGVAATGAGLPLNQPIPGGFTAPGATPQQALANAQMNGQPFGALASPAAGTALPGGGLQAYSNWGKDPVTIRPEYVPHLGNTQLLPGYLQGSGEFNQFRLDQPGLLGTIPGQEGIVNLRFGLGGTGDPTSGRELQTPERYVRGSGSSTAMQGDAAWRRTHGGQAGLEDAFVRRPVPITGGGGMGGGGYGYGSSGYLPTGGGGTGGGNAPYTGTEFFRPTISTNWGQTPETEGKGYIATLFLRGDTPTGIGTPAWSAPPQMWAGLAEELRKGTIVVNNPAAWEMLGEQGYTPNRIGGAALSASNAGAGASPAGAGTGGVGSGFGEGSFQNPEVMNAITSAAQVAYQRTYHEWLARNGDQQFALAQAKQAGDEAYRTASLAFEREKLGQQESQFGRTLGETQAARQQNTGIQAAQLMASLRGPANQFAASNAMYGLNRTTGVSNAVAALAGEYNIPSFSAPQALPQAASLGTLAQQLGAAGTGQPGDIVQQAQQYASGLPAPNKVVGRQYAALSPANQQLALAGYESLGYNADDVLHTITAGLPAFKAPSFGAVA